MFHSYRGKTAQFRPAQAAKYMAIPNICDLRSRADQLFGVLTHAGTNPPPVEAFVPAKDKIPAYVQSLQNYIADREKQVREISSPAVKSMQADAKHAATGAEAENLSEWKRLCVTGLTRSARRFWEANEQSLHASGASLEDIANATATEHDKQICRDATYIEYTRLLQTDPSAAGIFRALNATALDALL